MSYGAHLLRHHRRSLLHCRFMPLPHCTNLSPLPSFVVAHRSIAVTCLTSLAGKHSRQLRRQRMHPSCSLSQHATAVTHRGAVDELPALPAAASVSQSEHANGIGSCRCSIWQHRRLAGGMPVSLTAADGTLERMDASTDHTAPQFAPPVAATASHAASVSGSAINVPNLNSVTRKWCISCASSEQAKPSCSR